MFPYKDENPTERPAVITVAIIIANVLAFILVQGAGAQGPLVRSVCEFGLIPGEVLHSVKPGSGIALAPGMACLVGTAPKYWTVLTSMFMHGGWLHLIGNMVFLWVFGNNIEDVTAWVMLGYWILIQVLSGLFSLSDVETGGVAFFAHVGGFIAGLVLVKLFASEDVLRRRPLQPASYYRYRTY